MAIVIKTVHVDDLPELIAFWSGMDGLGLNESDEPRKLEQFLMRNPDLSRAAWDADQLVGAVLCGHDGRRGTLHHLAVAVAYRRHGLGDQLVDSCLSALRVEGIDKCNIFLFASNEQGEQFWRACGWQPRDDLRVFQKRLSELD